MAGSTTEEREVMNPFEDIKNSEIRNLIDEYIHSERDRSVLLDRYTMGYTYEKIAELHDLSTIQVKRIIYKGTDRLKERV